MDSALLVIDVQNDFMPGGALGVPDGNQIIPVIHEVLPRFQHVFWTRDNHPKDHCSFTTEGGIWPSHCVQGTYGSQIAGSLFIIAQRKDIITKGEDKDTEAYSIFKDTKGKVSDFSVTLEKLGINHLFVCGLATEYCVKETVLHALEQKIAITLIVNGIKGINNNDSFSAMGEMTTAGAVIIHQNFLSLWID